MFQRILSTLICLFAYSLAHSQPNIELPLPSEVALTVTGNIQETNQQSTLQLSITQLKALPQQTINTTTRWTEGIIEFKGPLLRDVIALAKGTGRSIKAIASNEYLIEIPFADVETYNVILALEQDGKALTMRTKGPIWVVYPWSDHKILDDGKFYARSIWQLKALDINE
ncbi:MAG: molybdopterin-dependent oxidoreductase [Oceanospirillaceae bacterium]